MNEKNVQYISSNIHILKRVYVRASFLSIYFYAINTPFEHLSLFKADFFYFRQYVCVCVCVYNINNDFVGKQSNL